MKQSRKLVSDNPRQVLRILFKRLGYPYTKELYDAMYQHPDFPSFLSFHYTLKRTGIENAALHIGYNELMTTMPMPAIVHVTTNVELFLVLERVDDKGVYVLNENGKEEFIARDAFLKMWEGHILIVDTENIPQAPKQKSIQKVNAFLNTARKPFLIFSGVCLLLYLLFVTAPRSWLSWSFLTMCGIGIAVSVLLLIAQFDKYNTFVKKLCTSKNEKSKRSCSSILDSKAAYFLGLFSWSDIGFVYFVALFAIVLLLPYEGIFVAMLVSLPAFGYVFYSILYQKFVARSWCTLCLAVQAVLALLFAISVIFIGGVDIKAVVQLPTLMAIIAITIGIVAAYIAVRPLIQARVEQRPLEQAYKLLKHQEDVKDVVIGKQQVVSAEDFCPIRIGNPDASLSITMAFGPMCQPCMQELQILIPFLRAKEDTLFELLFVFDREKNKEAEAIACDFLQLYINQPDIFLDELERYAISYPVSRYWKREHEVTKDEQCQINEIFSKHEAWRKAYKIHSTPVLFFNHKRLPSFYTAQDLDYMCS